MKESEEAVRLPTIVRVPFVSFLIAAMVAGCGDSGGGSDGGTGGPSATSTTTPLPASPTTTPTPSPTSPEPTASPPTGPLAFAVGGRVTVASNDGGFHWEPILPAGSAIDFADRSNGWVVSTTAGGEIRHTTDGGAHWTLQSEDLGFPRPSFLDIDAVDHERAVVAGRETVIVGTTEQPGPLAMFFTHDGGATWQRAALTGFDVNEFPHVVMRSVCVTAAGHGIAFGSDYQTFTAPELVLVTHDAGATWAPPMSTRPTSVSVKVDCAGERAFWLADGDRRRLWYSPDGGTTWSDRSAALPDDGSLLALDFDDVSEGRVLAFGNQRLRVLHTTDGGARWTSHDIVGSTGLFEIYAGMDFDGDRGVVVAQDLHPLAPPRSSFGVAFATADGGATWTETVFPEPINALWDVVLLP